MNAFNLVPEQVKSVNYVTYNMTSNELDAELFRVTADWCSLTSNWNTKIPIDEKIIRLPAEYGVMKFDITEIAKACEAAGADILALINTVLSMVIDIETRKPLLANGFGGLSGPAIKPLAVRMVWQTAQAVSIPTIGMGGITTAEDAIEFLLAGASAFQIGSANFHNPYAAPQILAGLEQWCEKHGVKDIQELVGAAQ